MHTYRAALANDIGSVPQISLDDFLEYFLPSLKIDLEELEAVTDRLTIEQQRLPDANNNGNSQDTESCTPDKSDRQDNARRPSQCDVPDPGTNLESVIAQLGSICDDVIASCQETHAGLSLTTRLIHNGEQQSNHGISGLNGSHYLVNATGHEKELFNCVCYVQYALNDDPKSIAEADQNLIWELYYTIQRDARRRFTLGMTVINSIVRLWHFSREVLVVSEGFDFNEDRSILIDVYIRLCFATMPDLGFDSMVTLLPLCAEHTADTPQEGKERRYRISVDGVNYIGATGVAHQHPARAFGKCTRVFTAYKEDDSSDDALIIKDCWLYADWRTEYEIYKDIEAAILAYDWANECHPPPENMRDLKTYKSTRKVDPRYGTLTPEQRMRFFSPILSGAKVTVDGQEDNTQDTIARGYQLSDERNMYPVGSGAIEGDGEDARRRPLWHADIKQNVDLWVPKEVIGCFFRPINSRTHHRLVMHKGQSMYDIAVAKEAFSTMTDASYAVFMLHCIQWLHRDISPDNIFRMPDGRGVLADLEFAQPASDPRTCDCRVGTPSYMALEVSMRKYMFPPSSPQGSPPWRYRDKHDLESLWWLSVWLLFRHIVEKVAHETHDPPKKADTTVKQTERDCARMFPGRVTMSKERAQALITEDALETHLRLLPPAWKKKMGPKISRIRRMLLKGYAPAKISKQCHPGVWLIVHDMCAAGQAIRGSLLRPHRVKVAQARAPADNVSPAPLTPIGEAPRLTADEQAVPTTGSGEVPMYDVGAAGAVENHGGDTSSPSPERRGRKRKAPEDPAEPRAKVKRTRKEERFEVYYPSNSVL
ncbi:uncharacterized protein SCHCODRAFT_02749325 [Schizophyllum commune H4-8]|nr:uncharacterized protein SCHCODRAFT_02749325 [Schizophyllum commune H4-8]KAI5891271.1 hypothetical protein SCHCODRAFT_02749325 [Schizophyllum commune H4-8]